MPRLLLKHVVFLSAILLLVPGHARSQVPSPPAWERDNQTPAVDHLDPVVIKRSQVPAPSTWERDDQTQAVDHLDPVIIDATLSLPKLIDLTMQKYPDTAWLTSLEEEAAAIAERSKSWTAGASYASIGYQSISTFRLNYATGSVQVPLWNIGQRDAQHTLANQAETSAESQAVAIKLRVAGLVRGALWDMALAKIRYEQAQVDLDTYEKLLATIKRYVAVGDMPRANELLAQTEFLQKRSVFTMAEAELMHSRKRYASITQTTKVPATYEENLAALKEIGQNHPTLVAINGQIERKQAELNAIKSIGSGQTNVIAGILSDEGIDSRSNKAEFFNVGVSVPFGGRAHIAPQIASINVELNRLIADREQLYRDLEQAHHEAEHNLEVNKVELGTANEKKNVSEELLKMTQLAFSVGEIDLMDLLKIQSQTQQAILSAKERAVMLQRDKALYNQAVGVMP
ncbi:MAG: TolC family protein, partial [Methylococcaceae bacterium]|nr:TolC family protein [Methylococcaceae bacterium]